MALHRSDELLVNPRKRALGRDPKVNAMLRTCLRGIDYRYLVDETSSLIFHGYDGFSQTRKGVLWGRGNGWFTVASIEVLEMLPAGSPDHTMMLENFRCHLHGVLATQHPSGAWHTVMNDSSTYLEMSATAAFAAGLHWAGEQNWGEPRHRAAADRAYAALTERISKQGEVLEASGGTPVMPTACIYNAVPFAVTGFSQGLAMLAFSLRCAGSRHENHFLEAAGSCG